MKKIIVAIGLLVLTTPFVLCESPETDAITRQAMLANKKAIVAQNINLTPDEEKVFWPAYDTYQIGLNKMTDDFTALVKKFAINYQAMPDDLATDLVNQYFKLEKARIDYRKSWSDKFQAMIAPKKVARLVQIENKLDAIMRAELAQQIPLVK